MFTNFLRFVSILILILFSFSFFGVYNFSESTEITKAFILYATIPGMVLSGLLAFITVIRG